MKQTSSASGEQRSSGRGKKWKTMNTIPHQVSPDRSVSIIRKKTTYGVVLIYKRTYKESDTRYLYGMEPHTPKPQAEGEGAPEARSHLRWHPLREEWVVYAAHRQERTFFPPQEHCPLCPSCPGAFPPEIPFEDFEIAVFQNRFPSFHPDAPVPPSLSVPAERAQGFCEVVVYTPQHTGSLATLSSERRELLVRVWADRYRELLASEFVRHVMPFENHGKEVGVTLSHPHGQMYACPFAPPIPGKEVEAFRNSVVLVKLLATLDDAYAVAENEHMSGALVPPFARCSYEVWIAPRCLSLGPWDFEEAEVEAFAQILGEVVARYDGLFDRPFLYVVVLHAAPKGEEATFHLYVEFYPRLRSPGKLKYRAGTELGAGTFVVDAFPEQAAAELREVEV